jgi:hypothetical protein
VVRLHGLRWDDQSWIDESQVSPRVNLVLAAGPQTTVRAAWGRFHQSQRLNELQVEDGVTEYFPSQRAEHWLASVEHNFRVQARFELPAGLFHLRPRYENQFSGSSCSSRRRMPESWSTDRGRARVRADQHDRGRAVLVLSLRTAVAEDQIDGDCVQELGPAERHSQSAPVAGTSTWHLSPADRGHAVLIENEDGGQKPEPVPGPQRPASAITA